MCKHILQKKPVHTAHTPCMHTDMHAHTSCSFTALSASMTCGLTPVAALKPPYTE